MGGCASTQNRGSTVRTKGNKPGGPPVIRVVHMDGQVKELNPPTCAAQILSQNPGYFLCCSDDMFIDSCPEHVPEPDELRPGLLYFLMPKSLSDKPLSLEVLCELAIKASSNLTLDDLHLSFRHYAL